MSLGDGRIVRWGDRVVLLQLENGALTSLTWNARSPMVAAPAARQLMQQSLEKLARRLATDPAFTDVRAIGALTYMWWGGDHLGVPAIALRDPLMARAVAWCPRGHQDPSGPMNQQRSGDRRTALCVWMSTTRFVERYGREREAPPWRPSCGERL